MKLKYWLWIGLFVFLFGSTWGFFKYGSTREGWALFFVCFFIGFSFLDNYHTEKRREREKQEKKSREQKIEARIELMDQHMKANYGGERQSNVYVCDDKQFYGAMLFGVYLAPKKKQYCVRSWMSLDHLMVYELIGDTCTNLWDSFRQTEPLPKSDVDWTKPA